MNEYCWNEWIAIAAVGLRVMDNDGMNLFAEFYRIYIYIYIGVSSLLIYI